MLGHSRHEIPPEIQQRAVEANNQAQIFCISALLKQDLNKNRAATRNDFEKMLIVTISRRLRG
jgi:hypothetical protein